MLALVWPAHCIVIFAGRAICKASSAAQGRLEGNTPRPALFDTRQDRQDNLVTGTWKK
jgi:hypothetical protein